MQCKDVEIVVEQEGLAPAAGSSTSARGHLQPLPGICRRSRGHYLCRE